MRWFSVAEELSGLTCVAILSLPFKQFNSVDCVEAVIELSQGNLQLPSRCCGASMELQRIS